MKDALAICVMDVPVITAPYDAAESNRRVIALSLRLTSPLWIILELSLKGKRRRVVGGKQRRR